MGDAGRGSTRVREVVAYYSSLTSGRSGCGEGVRQTDVTALIRSLSSPLAVIPSVRTLGRSQPC
jgi:hypothetical protein